jgi:NADH-quinone oxidoreductase subunit A
MDFTALIIFAVLAVAMPGTMLAAQGFLGPKVNSKLKSEPFECGQKPFAIAKGHLSIKFYQIAMLFIIFDLELVFLWPWAVSLRELGYPGLAVMGVFLGMLTLSYVYAWKKGVLRWES